MGDQGRVTTVAAGIDLHLVEVHRVSFPESEAMTRSINSFITGGVTVLPSCLTCSRRVPVMTYSGGKAIAACISLGTSILKPQSSTASAPASVPITKAQRSSVVTVGT